MTNKTTVKQTDRMRPAPRRTNGVPSKRGSPRLTDFLRARGEPVYDENILEPRDDESAEDDDVEHCHYLLWEASIR